jgi:uncharacterized damage-inducible protein DinB
MTWTAPAPASVDGPLAGDERPMLTAFLDWERSVLLNICAGLDAEQLTLRALPPSRLSLLGVIRHMTKVERIWFRQRAGRDDIAPIYGGAGNIEDFEEIDARRAEVSLLALQAEWAAADAAVASMDLTATFDVKGEMWSLRMVYFHMIDEYARHSGHADLLREAIDGVTGR